MIQSHGECQAKVAGIVTSALILCFVAGTGAFAERNPFLGPVPASFCIGTADASCYGLRPVASVTLPAPYGRTPIYAVHGARLLPFRNEISTITGSAYKDDFHVLRITLVGTPFDPPIVFSAPLPVPKSLCLGLGPGSVLCLGIKVFRRIRLPEPFGVTAIYAVHGIANRLNEGDQYPTLVTGTGYVSAGSFHYGLLLPNQDPLFAPTSANGSFDLSTHEATLTLNGETREVQEIPQPDADR